MSSKIWSVRIPHRVPGLFIVCPRNKCTGWLTPVPNIHIRNRMEIVNQKSNKKEKMERVGTGKVHVSRVREESQ